MGAALFYHLMRAPLELALPRLLGKALERGWRVAVRGRDDTRLEWLDQKLWLGPEESFLPHGLSGAPHDAHQPILLTTQMSYPNDPACLMIIDGAATDADEVRRFERVCILFDGHDDTAVQTARDQWKTLTQAGCSAQYWSEESGRWEMKAQT